MRVKISIVIPVYNVASYIEECLGSVIQQTYSEELECLIVDDCGTDESIAIAERIIESYEGPIQFRVIHHTCNRGLSAARNTGTEYAQGYYIYYLDGDDFLTENCIEKLMAEAVKDPSIELVQGLGKTYPDGNVVSEMEQILCGHPSTNQEVRNFLYKNHQWGVTAWNKLIKRSFVIQNHLQFREGIIYEDFLWTFYMMKCLTNVRFVSEYTYWYRTRPRSIISGTDKKTAAINYEIIYRDIITHLTPEYEIEEFKYYARCFSLDYRTFVCYYPTLKKVFCLFWKKAWRLHCCPLCVRLAASYVMGSYYSSSCR